MNKNLQRITLSGSLFLITIFLLYLLKKIISISFSLNIDMPQEAFLFSKFNAFKVFVIVSIAFIIYNKDYLLGLSFKFPNLKHIAIYIIIGIFCLVSYYLVNLLINSYKIYYGFYFHLFTIVGLFFLVLFVFFILLSFFGFEILKKIWLNTHNQIKLLIPIFLLGLVLLSLFEDLWIFFSRFILTVLVFILLPFYKIDFGLDIEGPWLIINHLSITIGKTCSSIDSILLFIAFFVMLFALDHKRIKKPAYAVAFVIGFIGVFFVNILRLLLLILIGVHISADFAVGLFHTNAGWLFFVLYFLVYYALIRRFIYIKG